MLRTNFENLGLLVGLGLWSVGSIFSRDHSHPHVGLLEEYVKRWSLRCKWCRSTSYPRLLVGYLEL